MSRYVCELITRSKCNPLANHLNVRFQPEERILCWDKRAVQSAMLDDLQAEQVIGGMCILSSPWNCVFFMILRWNMDISCKNCASGRYSSSVGQSNCDWCDLGRYSPTGARYCSDCPSGRYIPARGAQINDCRNCERGRYLDRAGERSCKTCPAGRFNPSARQRSINACKNQG